MTIRLRNFLISFLNSFRCVHSLTNPLLIRRLRRRGRGFSGLSPARAFPLCALLALAAPVTARAASVFSEDFSSATLSDKSNNYLVGWYGSPVAFGEWVRPTSAAMTISSGTLVVNNDSGTRSAAILLDPTLFPAAGQYTLTFDIVGYNGDGNDYAKVSVWKGFGYDLSTSSGNALILNAESSVLGAAGSATSSLLASSNYTTTGTFSLSFDYDGFSALALFLGAFDGGGFHPTITYDNINISSLQAVPEPSMAASTGLALAWLLLRRRRPRGGVEPV